MLLSYEDFQDRAHAIRSRIATACKNSGRDPSTVELLAVTKTYPAAAVDYAARYGLRAVGESRVQESIDKQPFCTIPIQWELIGHLQSNKAKLAATCFDRVQSVDSAKLLTLLDRAAGELEKTLGVLLQINAGQDPAKFGADPKDAFRLLETALACPHLRIDGLMTIAPLGATPAETDVLATRTFENLRTIHDALAAKSGATLRELSMGMSGDLEAAIRAGSTQVRIGTALYGSR